MLISTFVTGGGNDTDNKYYSYLPYLIDFNLLNKKQAVVLLLFLLLLVQLSSYSLEDASWETLFHSIWCSTMKITTERLRDGVLWLLPLFMQLHVQLVLLWLLLVELWQRERNNNYSDKYLDLSLETYIASFDEAPIVWAFIASVWSLQRVDR